MYLFYSATTYNSRSGIRDYPFEYACAHCGLRAPLIVRAEGFATRSIAYGTRNAHHAQITHAMAVVNADREAKLAFDATACPQCRQLQPSWIEYVDAEWRN